MNTWLSNKEIIRLWEEKQNFRHVCKCGHTVYIANKNGIAICSHCKNLVFKDKETEFKYRMKEGIINERRKSKRK